MAPTFSMLLLAAVASAQLTTTFWSPKYIFGPSDKVGFVGSVVNASNTHTVLALNYDNGTDSQLFFGADFTMTVGPNLWQESNTLGVEASNSSSDLDAGLYAIGCEDPNPDSTNNATCSMTLGPEIAREVRCYEPTSSQTSSTRLRTIINTYSGRGTLYSAGVETIVHTQIYGSIPDQPEWCNDPSYSEAVKETFAVSKAFIGIFQVVITAGEEKLSATQGGSASVSSPVQTGSQPPASATSGSGGAAASTGGAASFSGPAMLGLGAAAAFLL